MLISNETYKYLIGEEFLSIYNLKLPLTVHPEKRINFLKRIVEGKKVVHLGCLDHLPIIDEKINNNQWLHKILTNSAEKCIGFDINENGINELRTKYGIENIHFDDITVKPNALICNEKWDYILLGELLEHIDNPNEFLKRIIENYSDTVNQIIITVPNILARNRFNNAKSGFESINTDHRFWFTPFTLLKVATMAGLNPKTIEFKNRIPLNFFQLAYRKINKIMLRKEPKYPFYYFDTLVLISDLKKTH
jgi:hypothetical protein